jgi:hypothetical protein
MTRGWEALSALVVATADSVMRRAAAARVVTAPPIVWDVVALALPSYPLACISSSCTGDEAGDTSTCRDKTIDCK